MALQGHVLFSGAVPAEEMADTFRRAWELLKDKFAFAVRRDARYLNWKYIQPPHVRYSVAVLERGSDVDGYAVYRHVREPRGKVTLLVVAGASALIEMIYHIQLNAGAGSQFRFVGVPLDSESPTSWLASTAVLLVGMVALEFARRGFVRVWARAQEEIEAEIRQREPA